MKVIALCFLVLLTACTTSSPSPSDIQTAIAETQTAQDLKITSIAYPDPSSPPQRCSTRDFDNMFYDLQRRFDEAVTLANNTPKIQLPPVISEMQEILRKTERIIPPDCHIQLHEKLLGYMDETIKIFTNFLSEESNYQNIARANMFLREFQIEYGDYKLTEGIQKNNLRHVTDEVKFNIEQELENASRVTYHVTNFSEISVYYVTIGVFFDVEDGTRLILHEEYYPEIKPFGEVEIKYDRSTGDVIEGVVTEKTYIEILEAYISTTE